MIHNKRVVLLVGGVGGAKLAYGLSHVLPPENLTIIVNTADDFWHYGLRICPDLDTVMYTLSGRVDKTNGWGVNSDTTAVLDMLGEYGEQPWFRLGDRDIATHLLRSMWWNEGVRLTEITQRLSQRLGLECRLLPMTDSPVATIVETVEHGELAFQDYFVRHRWQPTVRSLRFDGIEQARLSPEVESAVRAADVIIIGPSNPWLSIEPILSIPGMRDLLKSQSVPRVAVTPIVNGKAIKGPAAKLMDELGYAVSVQSVIDFYAEVINGFVYDERDANLAIDSPLNIPFDTIMDDDEKRIVLAGKVLDWALRLATISDVHV
ncbi:MAG: 2-phospho-L-lactate transferase [bacterium]|nr:2-phospho-L-lactate transferase [bacterium]